MWGHPTRSLASGNKVFLTPEGELVGCSVKTTRPYSDQVFNHSQRYTEAGGKGAEGSLEVIFDILKAETERKVEE